MKVFFFLLTSLSSYVCSSQNKQLIAPEIIMKNSVKNHREISFHKSGIDTSYYEHYNQKGLLTHHTYKCYFPASTRDSSRRESIIECGFVKRTYDNQNRLIEIYNSSQNYADSAYQCVSIQRFNYTSFGKIKSRTVFQPCDEKNPKSEVYIYKDSLLICEMQYWPPTTYNHDTVIVRNMDSTSFVYDSIDSKRYILDYRSGVLQDSTIMDWTKEFDREEYEIYNNEGFKKDYGYNIQDSLGRTYEYYYHRNWRGIKGNWLYHENGLPNEWQVVNEEGEKFISKYVYEYFK